MLAYHFVGKTLRDGRPIPPIGETLLHKGEIELCRSGLHASVHPFDALRYAPGSILCLVEVGGKILDGGDKIVGSQRTILKMFDATELLRKFARLQALTVVHNWDAPEVVKQYLKTGDEKLRTTAESAAWSAARYAAESAAWSSDWSAAESAVWSAAWYAAESAARSAVARYAAESAARSAAESAVWSAARSAAARSAGLSAAGKMFLSLVEEEFNAR